MSTNTKAFKVGDNLITLPVRDCHDCRAKPGELHMNGCDTEVCAACGGQAISCGCPEEEYEKYERLPWEGIWPGTLACMEYDLWCYWGPDHGKSGWVECDKDHPGARSDLNRCMLLPFGIQISEKESKGNPMLKAFNAFQITALFAVSPLGLQWLFDSGRNVWGWIALVLYAVFFIMMCVFTYTAIERE